MVQDANNDLVKWFTDGVKELEDWEQKWILRRFKYVLNVEGPRIEKQIFKYIARYVVNRLNPPTSIEGMEINYKPWTPLTERYAKRKGHRRKFFKSGDLKRYLGNIENAQRWYGKPKTTIDYANKIITYHSMFSYDRKPFRAHDPKTGKAEESKIQMKNDGNFELGGDNPLRELIGPMEDFLLNKKLNAIIDEKIKTYMEERYAE